MLISTDQLEAATASARAFSGRDSAALSKADLLAAVDAAGLAMRAGQALLAQFAGEVELRSAPELGMGLAKEQGFGSAPRLIANVTGGSLTEARRLVEAGAELCGPSVAGLVSQDGCVPPEALGALAQALAGAQINVHAAALIRETLRVVRTESPDRDSADLERRLVEAARRVDLSELRRICEREHARHDVGALERREKLQWDARCASITAGADGMLVLTAALGPAQMEPVKQWFDAYVGAAFQRGRDSRMPEERKAGQIRADGLIDLVSHALGCDSPVNGVKTTVVVRMTLDELQGGSGVGEADATAAPISIGTLRAMMADAQVIPCVLGGGSAVLDWGRSTRLFTSDQKLALVERDGGCSWCLAPPNWCDAHHIRWWERDCGPTDLSNGVLLCRSCHMRIHHTGWTIVVKDNVVWFNPPPGSSKGPVIGGRARLLVDA
jgi:hypothetical protein